MKSVIDTIFDPVINWLNGIWSYLMRLSVPLSRPVDIADYLGPFALLGSYWTTFISTACVLGTTYLFCYLVVSSQGVFSKFKDMVKWW